MRHSNLGDVFFIKDRHENKYAVVLVGTNPDKYRYIAKSTEWWGSMHAAGITEASTICAECAPELNFVFDSRIEWRKDRVGIKEKP